MTRVLAIAAVLLMLSACAGTSSGPSGAVSIKEQPISYKADDTTLRGFVVYDEAAKGRRPGIILVHEWWGITKHMHNEARRFAQNGYTVLIADMFGEGRTADNPKDAGALAGSVMKNPAAMQSRFNAARAELARHPSVDAAKIAAAGYCFGGTVALNMARAGADLAGVAAFHAGLGTNTPAPKAVRAKILVLNGADDPLVKPDQIEAFKRDMDAARADYRFINYPGAVHAFTNPEATEVGKKFNMPVAYSAKVDKEAKAEADKFFAELFRK
jgi:dienelactone hydrolase